MPGITDKSGNTFTLDTSVKYSWGYLVLINGKSTGGGGLNLFIGSDGLAHVVNTLSNEYKYSGGWVFVQKTTPLASTNAGGAPITPSSGLQEVNTSPSGQTPERNILSDVSFSVEGGKKSQLFLIAGGILVIIGIIVISVTGIFRKRKKR